MVTKRRSWTPIITFISIILISMIGMVLAFCFIPIVTQEDGIKFTVHEGRSLGGVVDDLHRARIIRYEFFYKVLVRVYGGAEELKAGEYFFPKGTTPTKMLQQLTTGSGMLYHSFSIIPGWTLKDLRRALLRNSSFKHVSSNLSDSDLMKALGYPELQPEGQFFPDTYFFIAGSEDILLLKRALKTMHKKLDTAWINRAPNLPFKTPYEVLIAASIIEKEAYLKKELPIIAGVMINRLRHNMRLQFDPTVIYGVGDKYEGKIRKVDLQDKNPYNTYLNKGLPPTPISMPSLSAINAVLHPAQHEYFYFVAQGKGAHRFSKQLSEHNDAVALMRKSKGTFNLEVARQYLVYVSAFSLRAASPRVVLTSSDSLLLSFPRRREPMDNLVVLLKWVPAFAGMTKAEAITTKAEAVTTKDKTLTKKTEAVTTKAKTATTKIAAVTTKVETKAEVGKTKVEIKKTKSESVKQGRE